MPFLTYEDFITERVTYMSRTVTDMLQRTVRATTEATIPFIKEVTPIGQYVGMDGSTSTGGQLRASLYWQIGTLGAVLHGAEQGVFVAGGTAPHAIYPRAKKALAFYWPKGGGATILAHVNHPGTKANDFRQKGMAAALGEDVVQQTILSMVSQWASGEGA